MKSLHHNLMNINEGQGLELLEESYPEFYPRTSPQQLKVAADHKKTYPQQAMLNIEQLPSRIHELLQTRETASLALEELIDMNTSLQTGTKKVDIELYCMNSMDDHRYSFLKDYLPNARNALSEREDAYSTLEGQAAQRLGCPIDSLEDVLHPGGDKPSQTSGVPDDYLTMLECYDQEGCRAHIDMTYNHLTNLRDVLTKRKAEIKLEEDERHRRLDLLRKMCMRLGYQVKELERKQDAAKWL